MVWWPSYSRQRPVGQLSLIPRCAWLTHSSQRHACWWSPQHLWRGSLKWACNRGAPLALRPGHPNSQLPEKGHHINNSKFLVFPNISGNIRHVLSLLFEIIHYDDHDKDVRPKWVFWYIYQDKELKIINDLLWMLTVKKEVITISLVFTKNSH